MNCNGHILSQAYANLVMGKLEEKLLDLCKPTSYGKCSSMTSLSSGQDLIKTLYMTNLNHVNTTIKFTHESSETELTFFDITVFNGNKTSSNHIQKLSCP